MLILFFLCTICQDSEEFRSILIILKEFLNTNKAFCNMLATYK